MTSFSTTDDSAQNLDELRQENARLMAELQQAREQAQKMRTKRDRLLQFFELSEEMFCVAGSDGYFLWVSAAWTRVLGYTSQELKSQPFLTWVHPDDRDRTSDMLQHMQAGIETPSFSNRYRCKDGSYRWLSWSAMSFSANLTYAIARDITASRAVEQELARQRELLDAFFAAAPMGLAINDRDLRFTHINQVMADINGKPIEEHLGKSLAEALPDIADNLEPVFHRVLAGESVINIEFETPAQSQPDVLRHWLVSYFPLPDAKQQPIGVCAAVLDISDRKRAEAELQRSEARLRRKVLQENLLNRLTHQIRHSLDVDTILETAVREIRLQIQAERCQFAWYVPDYAKPYWKIVAENNAAGTPIAPSCYPAAYFHTFTQTLLELEPVRVDDMACLGDRLHEEIGLRAMLAFPIQTNSGMFGLLSVSETQQPRRWTDAETRLLQSVCNSLAIAIEQADLYQQMRDRAHQLETTLHELQRTQTQLVQSEKMSSLGQLVAGVAHEINNPVNFIYGNLVYANDYTRDILNLLRLYRQHYPNPTMEIAEQADAIDVDFLVEDLPKLLNSMKVGADRIQEIVASLRNFSRMDEADYKLVDVHEGINSTLMILQNRLRAKTVRIDEKEYYSPGINVIQNFGDLPQVYCFPGQLNQVFMNILANAIDALEERDCDRAVSDLTTHPSTIEITTAVLPNHHIRISIKDNGPGIAPHHQQYLFNPFFTTKPIGKGTGLGMSISYQIITEKHGGSLRCHSDVGQGAEFIIEIPVEPNAELMRRA
ncbi:PAS domain-containing sensor histidine kinase [Leptolyngbya sp. AN02str]|uniref:PAS domain-containing sensor histidine kinase n=1 Tax=Leptolyngbya sp. AN02str TaxID=3423363 RepID=UPI003D31CB19